MSMMQASHFGPDLFVAFIAPLVVGPPWALALAAGISLGCRKAPGIIRVLSRLVFGLACAFTACEAFLIMMESHGTAWPSWFRALLIVWMPLLPCFICHRLARRLQKHAPPLTPPRRHRLIAMSLGVLAWCLCAALVVYAADS